MTVASGEVAKYCYTLLWFSEGCSETQGMYTNFPGREGMHKCGCMLSRGDLDAARTIWCRCKASKLSDKRKSCLLLQDLLYSKEGYHPLWRDPIESALSADMIERSSPNICSGCWTEGGCVKIARERRIPCNPLTMLGSKAARYAWESSGIYSFSVLWASEIN